MGIMRTRAVRTLGVAGAALTVSAAMAPAAAAAVDYEGSAETLAVEGFTLTLFPGGITLADGLELPETTLEVEDEHGPAAAYTPGGSDELAGLEIDGLLSTGLLTATSDLDAEGHLVSTATVHDLALLGTTLTADTLEATCVADGEDVTPSAIITGADSASGVVKGTLAAPNTEVALPGVGELVVNAEGVADDGNSGAAAAVVLDVDTDLDADELGRVPGAVEEAEALLRDLLADLTVFGGPIQLPLELPADVIPDDTELADMPLSDLLTLLDALNGEDTLNAIAHLTGSVVVAAAYCAQTVTADAPPPAPQPQTPPGQDPVTGPAPANPPARAVPTLPATGASDWALGGLALTLLAAGSGLVYATRRPTGS